jgi:hypothetical protein
MPTLATLVEAVTSDDYTAAATVEASGARNADITVSDTAVMMQVAHQTMPGVPGAYGLEERVLPRSLIISDEPIYGVRFRSAIAGTPGTVDVTLST